MRAALFHSGFSVESGDHRGEGLRCRSLKGDSVDERDVGYVFSISELDDGGGKEDVSRYISLRGGAIKYPTSY